MASNECNGFSDSGIGDFGPEGINAFVEAHTCGDICKRLGLNDEVPLQLLDRASTANSGGTSAGSTEKDNDSHSDDDMGNQHEDKD